MRGFCPKRVVRSTPLRGGAVEGYASNVWLTFKEAFVLWLV